MKSDGRARPTLLKLALTFNHIALASFGGGLSAWSREVIVVEKGWMAEEEFLSAITMCRILPGANQVNLAVFVGAKFRGVPGAIAAVVGLSFVPVLIILGLGYAYFQFHRFPPSRACCAERRQRRWRSRWRWPLRQAESASEV